MPRHRQWLVGAAASLLSAAILFAPLSRGVPRAFDLRDHLGVAAQVLSSFRAGVLYPRWMPDLHDGWGEPTLLFYPPGLYFLSAALAALARGDVLFGLFSALVLFAVAGGLGAFVFVGRRFGTGAGALAALAFGLTPFRVFEVHAAGLCSAFAAASLVPWAFVALEDAAGDGPPAGRRIATAAWPLLFAAIVLVNLPASVLVAYLVATWLVIRVIATRRVRGALRVAAGGAWGSAIAGVYLIPALAEMPAVQILGTELYRSNFLFRTSSGSAMSAGLQSTFDRMGIFPGLALLASLGALEAARQRGMFPSGNARRSFLLLVAVTGVTSLFLATSFSRPAWDWLPVLQRVNLPWRFLEPLGFAAVSASAATVALLVGSTVLPRTVRLTVIAFLLLLAGVGLAFDASLSAVNGKITAALCRATIPQFARKEGYFRPTGAQSAALLAGTPPLACDQPCRVAVLDQSPERRRFQVAAQAPMHLAVRTYFFPGWTAERVDGPSVQPLPIGPEMGTGRIVVEVPAGESLIVLRFGTTPARRAGGAVSVLALLAWAAWLVSRRRGGDAKE
jgi:uncharacterized membrane protein